MPEDTFIARRWAKPAPQPVTSEDAKAEATATWTETDDDDFAIDMFPTRWSRAIAENQYSALTGQRIEARDQHEQLTIKRKQEKNAAERDNLILQLLELELVIQLAARAAQAFERWLEADRRRRKQELNRQLDFERSSDFSFSR